VRHSLTSVSSIAFTRMRRGLVAAVIVVAALVAGCDTVTGPTGWLEGEVQSNSRLREASQAVVSGPAGIRVEPVVGPARPMAKLLAESVAKELSALNIAASARSDAQGLYVLRGRALLNRTEVLDPSIVLIEWQLTDQAGDLVAIHTQGIRGTWVQWDYGDPAIVRQTGREVARYLGSILGVEEALLTGAPAFAVNLLIRPVSGAPGDGNQALTNAVRQALRATGIAQASLPEKASHVLEGRVEVLPPLGGQQRVTITWTVASADGGASRRVVQQNSVSSGALDGDWGQTAQVAAWAAVPGIEQALEALLKG